MTAPADNQARSDGADDEGRVYNVGGEDWDEVVAAAGGDDSDSATSAWSSTWARSTRRPTACCGWS